MKKTKTNPDWETAKYDLGWLVHGKIGPKSEPNPRSNHKPPVGISKEQWDSWMKSYAIHPTIEVDEP